MVTSRKLAAAIVASAVVLCGCAQSDGRPEPVAEQTSANVPKPTDDVVFADGDFVHYFETFEEMATVDVVIAKVVGARDGVIPPGGDGSHEFSERRRVLTFEVTETLAGAMPETFEIQTLGWVVDKEGRRTPLTFEGMPWLEVGDEAVMALDDPNNVGEPGFASEASVQVFEDGRVAPAPARKGETPPPLSQAFEGMTKSEVVSAFSNLGS